MEEPIVLTASNIRYLLAMKELDHDGSGVRCSAIANALRLSKPSVHNMMNTFRRLGLVQKDAYRACFLPTGAMRSPHGTENITASCLNRCRTAFLLLRTHRRRRFRCWRRSGGSADAARGEKKRGLRNGNC